MKHMIFKYDYIYNTGRGSKPYRFAKNNKYNKGIVKTFATLSEAIVYRNEYLIGKNN